jgi:hypothetical protein
VKRAQVIEMVIFGILAFCHVARATSHVAKCGGGTRVKMPKLDTINKNNNLYILLSPTFRGFGMNMSNPAFPIQNVNKKHPEAAA